MGRRGQLPDESVHKIFKLLTIPGVKTPVAECECCFKYRKARNTYQERTYLLEECTQYYEILSAKEAKVQSTLC